MLSQSVVVDFRCSETHAVLAHSTASMRHFAVAFASRSAEVKRTLSSSPLLQTVVAGGCAGAVSRTLTAPLDRMKVLAQEGRVLRHIQGSSSGAATGVGAKELFLYLYRTGGAAAFWRGNGVNCLKAGPEQAAAFTARQFYLPLVCADVSTPTFGENCAVGSLAGLSAQALLYPMEVVKTRMAVADAHEYDGILDCFKQSIQRGGLRDLYVGLFANAVGIIPHRGLEMGTFFTLERIVRQKYFSQNDSTPSKYSSHKKHQTTKAAPLPVYATLGISFAASLVSQVITYPLNLVRTKLQTQGVNGRPVLYKGIRDCVTIVLREEGARGLFSGIVPNMMKSLPASMLMYLTFSSVMNALQES
jgi:solute carrier family 25 (mitochondrial phosphate transporter), member 23/24/25/41